MRFIYFCETLPIALRGVQLITPYRTAFHYHPGVKPNPKTGFFTSVRLSGSAK